jgi:hypothetical protein
MEDSQTDGKRVREILSLKPEERGEKRNGYSCNTMRKQEKTQYMREMFDEKGRMKAKRGEEEGETDPNMIG